MIVCIHDEVDLNRRKLRRGPYLKTELDSMELVSAFVIESDLLAYRCPIVLNDLPKFAGTSGAQPREVKPLAEAWSLRSPQ